MAATITTLTPGQEAVQRWKQCRKERLSQKCQCKKRLSIHWDCRKRQQYIGDTGNMDRCRECFIALVATLKPLALERVSV